MSKSKEEKSVNVLKGSFFTVLVSGGIIIGLALTLLGAYLAVPTWTQQGFWSLVLIALGTAILAAFSIGIMQSYYRAQAEYSQKSVLDMVGLTGYSGIYEEDDDPKYRELLSNLIEDSSESMVFAGIGVSILHHCPRLLDEIVDRARNKPKLTIQILLGDYRNEAVICRQEEERAVVEEGHTYIYDTEWLKSHTDKLNSIAQRAKNKNISCSQLNCCPMLSIIRIDNHYFFAPYGCARSGGRSPRIHFEKSGMRSRIVKFLDETLDGYIRDSHPCKE